MVAIIDGASAGVNLSGRELLRPLGLVGQAAQGRSGEAVTVNVANGLLVLQSQDDFLAARGGGYAALRTYNSAGTFNDDNGDRWSSGVVSLLTFGQLREAGSRIQRIDADGSTATYNWDATRGLYVATDGEGAYDTISFVDADAQYEWRDGSTGATQRFEGTGARRLLASRDAAGNTLTYAYGAGGFLASVTAAKGDQTVYDYQGNQLTQIRTISGGVSSTRVRYTYDGSNRLASVVIDLSPSDNSIADGKVYRTQYTYDGTSTRIASLEQTDGTRLRFAWVDTGGGNYKLASVTDALSQTTLFTYAAGATTVTDPLGLVTRYEYDSAGRLTRITPPAVAGASAPRQFAYDASGNVISVTDGEGRTTTFGYDANGNQVLQRDAAGNTLARRFDAGNRLLTQTVYQQPASGTGQPTNPQVTRYVYDPQRPALLRFVITAQGRVTEYRFDAFGQRIAALEFAGLYPVASLDAQTVPDVLQLSAWTATQDGSRVQRSDFAWDPRGLLQSRTRYARTNAQAEGMADGTQAVERFVYDAAGRLLTSVSAQGGSTQYAYDGLGRVIAVVNAAGQTTITRYDDAGRKTAVTLASGVVSTSAYDAAGQLIAVTQASAAGAALGETRYFYDADGRLRMTQEPTGMRHWTLWDEAGRQSADIDANGTMTEYSYDRAGNLVRSMAWGTAVDTSALVDADGLPKVAVTPAALRPTASGADHGSWREYDAANRLVRVAESWGTGGRASVTETRYDGASRVVQVLRYANTVPTDFSTGSATPGRVPAPASSGSDRITRNFYDADGRLAGTLDAEGYLQVFNYDGQGNLVERVAYATATAVSLRASGTLAQLLPAASPADQRERSFYDGRGLRVGQLDAEGGLTENVYDGNGNVTRTVRYATAVSATVNAGSLLGTIRPASTVADQVTQRSYDTLDRLVRETGPDGVVTEYRYDAAGRLVSTSRAVGTDEVRTVLARYDLQGRLTGELSAEGAALLTGGQTQAQIDDVWAHYGSTHAYDAAGRRIATTDARGQRTLFFYNADGALTHTVNALGEVRETRYDARGRVVQAIAYAKRLASTVLAGLSGGLVTTSLTTAIAGIADPAQDSVTTTTWTQDDQVASRTDAEAGVTRLTYNAFGEEIARALSGTGVSEVDTYTLDRRGLRTGSAQSGTGLTATTTAVYDAFGRLVRSIDANGRVSEQVFDRLGRIVVTRDPLNATRSTSYDALGRVLTQTDALGNVTRYAYDTAARSMTVTSPEGVVTVTTTTRHGQTLSVTDGLGQVITRNTYDRNGNLLQTRTPLTASGSNYDALGQVLKTIDESGNEVAYTYDAAGRVLTRRVDPNGLNLTTTYAYDGKGLRVSVTDANGSVTTTAYDRKGQVLRQTVDPGGLSLQTVYSWDARGNMLSVLTPAGSLTQYTYDALGRRTQERVDPAGMNLQRSWSYDAKGNVVASTDALGNVTRYAYDAADQLVYTLDPLGNVRESRYDAAGRVIKDIAYATSIATTGLGAAPAVADIQALVRSAPTLDQAENRVLDKDGRLAATVDGTGAVVRYTYDARGNVVARIAYAARIDLANWTPGTLPAPQASASQDEVLYTIRDAIGRAAYTMDGTGAVVAYTYAGNGSVLQRIAYAKSIAIDTARTAAAVSAAVALVADAAHDATTRNVWDAAGRLAWTADGTGAVTQHVYDANGNVVREVAYATALATAAASPSTVVASANDRTTAMAYDKANRLVWQVDALRGATELAYDADGHVVRRTAYARPLASLPTLGTSGTAAAIRAALTVTPAEDRSNWYTYDQAGRAVFAVDATGAITETRYDGVGNVTESLAYTSMVDTGSLTGVPTVATLRSAIKLDAANDRSTRSAWDAAGRLVFSVDALGAVTANQYDGLGRLTRSVRYAVTIPAAANTAAAISTALKPDASRDQADSYGYNAAGQRITVTDAMGRTESWRYDALGRKTAYVNKLGATWTYAYDVAGHLLSETSPQVQLTTVSQAGNGALTAAAPQAAAVVTRMEYDALGRMTVRREAVGRPEERVTKYEYDAAGRQVRVTYPAAGVYDNTNDALTTNGATGIASRVEVQRSLETRTFYDALGNAVANIDVAGALSQKAYDAVGRVAYEVDALGFVTGYTRNAFGDITKLLRYGSATTLGGRTVARAADAVSQADVTAAVTAAGVNHGGDRQILTSYDRIGRAVTITENSNYFWDPNGVDAAHQRGTASRITRHSYDAFGQLVQDRVLWNAPDVWVSTTHYYDKLGREIATIDGLGYVTQRTFDSAGNLLSTREFATAVQAGWTAAGYAVPAASGDDRKVDYAYDLLNRKVSETRRSVEYSSTASAVSTRGDLVTRYGYDALGNQTQVTDALGGITYTYYDALGRIAAVAAPARSSTVAGTAITPLTSFRRDAYGNVIAQTEHAQGAQLATASGYAAAGASSDDHVTVSRYDSLGHVVQTTDASGASTYSSYDAGGHLAKQWQGVTGSDGVVRTSFTVLQYDKLGRVIAEITPASTSKLSGSTITTVSQAQAGVVSDGSTYNGFGERTGHGQEYFEYNNLGLVWRTNSGDGVDRVNLYDLRGNLTAVIRSSGSGRSDVDARSYSNPQAADLDPSTRRVDMQYDALGRLVRKQEAARQELQGGVSVQRQFVTASISQSASEAYDESGPGMPVGKNEVRLSWNSLAGLGSGDIKVTLEYRTAQVLVQGGGSTDESGNWIPARDESGNLIPALYRGGTPRSYASGMFTAEAAATGATLTWEEPAGRPTGDYGISAVTRIQVWKKDVNGAWQLVVDQTPGHGGNEITLAAPSNPRTTLTLQLRTAGTAGDGGWWTANLLNYGDVMRMDARSLSPGNYEYRVTTSPLGEAARVTATGTLAITLPPLNAITTRLSFSADGVLAWQGPGSGYDQVLRYRPAGSAAAWSSLAVTARSTPTGMVDGVDASRLAAGSYDFELLWIDKSLGMPVSHAIGSFAVVAAQAAYWVPPVNLPAITGLAVGSTLVGQTPSGAVDESGAPIYLPVLGTGVTWTAANATVARWRAPGGNWTAFDIQNSRQGYDESGALFGEQSVGLQNVPVGTWQVEILAGSPATAQATATLTVYGQSPGYYRTEYVQVPVRTPSIAYYSPIYETRYGTRQVSWQEWVAPSGAQFLGYGEDGLPMYGVLAGYDNESGPVYTYLSGHYETRYRTETYAYQVQVGQTPVYATDEDGSLIYQVSYVSQARQVWVPGTTPTPTIAVTTPPYTPGHWVAATPRRYGVGVSTPASSVAISTTDGSTLSQSAAKNGDAQWLRPTVQQKLDRWGNVLEITDPRSPNWKTTYRYNASNQLVQQTQPDANGATGSASPVTSLYYDALGRQVAIKDANGNVIGQVFDAGGNLVEERHADGGVVRHRYDAFGNRSRSTDALGRATSFSYDKLGHMLNMVQGTVDVWQVNGANALVKTDTRSITQRWTYDELGRKLSQTNGNGEQLRYTWDLRGNLVATVQPLGQAVRAAFDAQDRKIAEVDANGIAATWTYDYFGLLTGHKDSGGATYFYTYDKARQLIRQSNSRGQNLSYAYDAAGQVTRITDGATGKVTTYAYDLGGRKLRERVTQGGVTYQDNHLAYDAQGLLRDVADARVHVTMDYDKVGNRTRVATSVDYQGVSGEAASASSRYFQYDAMNRQVVVDAVDAAGNLGTQGHRITYDKNGNRTSDTWWGNRVVKSGGETTLVGYDEDNAPIYQTTPVTYSASSGLIAETYGYDALDRLVSVTRDGTQIDARYYDGADRVVQSGPQGALPTQYVAVMNQGLAPGQSNGKETRVNRYDANGRMLHQRLFASDGTLKADISWDRAEQFGSYTPDGYDQAGNALGYVVVNAGGPTNEYTTSLARYEGYVAASTSAVSTQQNPGTSAQQYDANGYLVGVTDSTQPANNRSFVNDANGRALFVNQQGRVQRQLIVNGEVLGLYGAGVDPNNPASGANNNPNFANVVDFDFGYARISASYPNASPGAYQVRAGETLQSIAQSAYGDSTLWWRIAEANGIDSNSGLRVGQTLNIPNRVGTAGNRAESFKPYDPSRIQGDTSPSLATPQQGGGGGCGGVGKLLMVVVAVVVTIYTAGAAAAAMGAATGAAGGTMAAGMAAMQGAYGLGIAMAAGAAGAAAGSIASQAVGIAIGEQEDFNWKSVGLSALSGGISAGLMGGALGNAVTNNVIVRAAVGNALTQGIGVVTGLQSSFDWKGVAASAVGAGVGDVVGSALKMNTDVFRDASFGEQLGKRLITGMAAGVTAAVARGGRVVVQQVAVDAFGNVIGDALTQSGLSVGESDAAGRSPDYPDGSVARDELRFASRYEPDADQARGFIDAFASAESSIGAWGDDVLVAGGKGFTMGRGPVDIRQEGRTVYIADARAEESIESMLARAQAQLTALQASQRDSKLTEALNRASVIRETVTPISPIDGFGASMDVAPFAGPDAPATSLDSIRPLSAAEGFFTFNPAGKLLKGVGAGAVDLVAAPLQLAKEAALAASDTAGYAAAGVLNWMDGQDRAYAPDGALYRSLETNGALGTFGLAATGAVRGLLAPIDALYRGDLEALGQSTPAMLLAAARPFGGLSRVGEATGLTGVDKLVLQGDAARAQIVRRVGELAQPSLDAIYKMDPDALVGFRGSLATGVKGEHKLGARKERLPFDGRIAYKWDSDANRFNPYTDLQGYDVDLFVVSDRLAGRISRPNFFRNLLDAAPQLRPVVGQLDRTMRADPVLDGMRPKKVDIRIWREDEMARILRRGESPYFFLRPAK